MAKTFEATTPWGGTEEVTIHKTKYAKGGLAIQLFCDDGIPYATLTVNLKKVPDGYAYVDTNNLPFAEEFINRYKLGKYVVGQDAISGFCVYPLYHFDMDKLNEYAR